MLFSLDPTPAGPDKPASPRKSPFTNADGKPLIRALLSVPLAPLADLKWWFWAPSTFQAEGGECHRAALLDSGRTGARTNPGDTHHGCQAAGCLMKLNQPPSHSLPRPYWLIFPSTP